MKSIKKILLSMISAGLLLTSLPVNALEVDNNNYHTTISVTDKFIEVKGQKYTLENLDDLLTQIEVYSIQPRSAIAIGAGRAVIYYIPGVGQVAVLATGATLIGGVTITVGHWAYKKVKAYLASEHKKMHVLVLMINILNLDPDA